MTDVAARARPAPQADEPIALPASALVPCDVAESWGKRALDIAGAAFALLLFLPLLLTIAMLVRLESGGPVIFRQRRTGHHRVPASRMPAASKAARKWASAMRSSPPSRDGRG